MPIQPLPQQMIIAHKLRDEAKRLLLLADELEASAEMPERAGAVRFRHATVKTINNGGKKCCDG